jgi:hypothetical protein
MGAKFTGVGIVFEALRSRLRPADPKQIRIAVGEARHEACPCSISKRE